MLFAILVFGGMSSSFADNCYYSDASGQFCFETVEEWLDYLVNEIKCEPSAGYINSNGEVLCCPTELEYINANPETGFCECKTGYGMVFDPEISGCVCPTGTEWFDNIGEPGCCANIVGDKCCYYYSFDTQNEQDLCYSFNEWIDRVNQDADGAGYIDENGALQGCPAGTNPNTQTGFCELTCAKGEYVQAGDYVCTSCPNGYDCPGGRFNVIDYENDQGVGDPIIYTITLRNYNNTSTHQTIYEKYDTGWYSNSAATSAISAANIPTRSGYTFRGYYTTQQSDLTATGGSGTRRITNLTSNLPSSSTFAANTNLYAAWAKDCTTPSNGSCTLTINSNGTATYTTSCNSGYTISGNGTATPTCTATSSGQNYTITLNFGLGVSNGNTASGMIYVYNGNYYLDYAHTQQMTTSSNGITIPQRTNYTFTGYVGYCGSSDILMIDSNGKITSDALSCVSSIAYDTTLTAGWTYSGPTGNYHITYYRNDAMGNPTGWDQYSNTNSFTIHDAGDAFFAGGVPATNSDGRTFSGWCANNYYLAPGDVYNPGAEHGNDLTAKYCGASGGNAAVNAWVPSVSELISMGYQSNETGARSALCGTSRSLLGATKCDTGYSMNTSPDGNIIGHYVVNGELVRLLANCDEGSYITSCTACTNKPSHSHYTASSSSLGGNCPWECDTGYTASGNSCVVNTITLNWNENGGNAISNGSCTYGGNLVLPSAPTYSGRTFAGWKTANGAVYNAGATITGGCTDTYTGVTSGTSTAIQAQWDTMSISCNAGQYLPAGATSCAPCPADSYCPNAASYQYNSSQAQGATSCPTGYTADTTTGKTTESQCAIYCVAGKRISTPGGTCNDNGNGPWVTTTGQTVYYGNISPVTYCMYGYNTMGSTYHSDINSCNRSVNAGYYVANVLPNVTQISISSTDELQLAEISAYTDYNGTNAVGLSLSSGNGTDLSRAIDGQYNGYAIIPTGNQVVFRMQANGLRSIRIALTHPAQNVTITAHSEVNGDVVVFQGDISHSIEDQVQGWAVAPTGELIVLSSIPMECPAGQYSTASYAYLPTGTSCSNVTAGYYTSGGGTSATPTAAGNGCLSGKTCGKCPTGWPHSVAGSNEITDCYSGTKSRAWSGTQVACTNPDTTGCSAVTCASCSNPACNYVAYVNAAGNADGAIKSGCTTNNASCQQTVESLTPNTGYHTISGNLEYCPANTYTVTLNKNNGTGGTSSVTVTYDADMPTTSVTMPTRTGYTFAGYYDTNASTGGKQYYTAKGTSARVWDKTTANPVLYARWAPNMYTVTLSKNTTDTGATDGTSPVVAFYGQAMPTSNPNLLDTAVVTDKGCVASTGVYPYSDGGSGTFYNVFFRVQPNTTYTYTATTAGTRRGIYEFDSIIDPSTYTTANKITPTRVYKAGGSSGLTTDTFTTSSTTQMVMLYLGNGGNAPTGLQIFPKNIPVRANLTAPTRTNYDLTGYYDATSNGTKYYNYTGGSLRSARTWNKTSDTTLYAQWSQNTVTINLDTNNNGGSGSCDASVTCDAGASCALPHWNSSTCNMTNGSKIFVGWATTNNATSGTFNITAPSSGTSTYYAVWKSPTCSVTNGSGTIQNTTTNEPKCQATCDTGYHTSGTYYGNAGETTVEYECTQTIYTVNYNFANGYMPVDYIVSDGTNYIQTDVYNDLNKDFMIKGNLYRNSESGLKRVFSNYDNLPILAMQIQNDGKVKAFIGPASGSVITSNTALALNSPVPYTLTYDKTQRSATFSLNGDTVSLSNIPAYSNASTAPLRFFLDYGDPTPIARPVVAADTSITQDNILVAKFIPARKNSTSCGLFDTVRSKFYTNAQGMNPFTCPDQISSLPVSYTYGVGATISGTPLREGYTFAGWTGDNGNTAQTTVTIGTTANGNKTYKASWAPNQYTISYDLNGGAWGSGTIPVETYNIETSTFAVENPTKLGYTFNGWTIITAPTAWGTGSSSDGAINFNIGRGTYGNIVMKANWTINTYTITVSAGNGVSTVSGTGWTNTGTASMSKTYNYGATIDLGSVVTPTNKAGYYGTTYTVSGSGSLSNGTFTVGTGNATITINAEGITAPTAENVTLATSVTTGTYGYNSPKLTGTVANASTDYDSGISLYYKLGYVAVSSTSAECPSSGYNYTDTPSAGTDNAITLQKDAFLAYRCYKVQVYATDGVLTSTTTDSSNAVNVSLIQRRLKFNGNEGTVNGNTYKYGYAKYGTSSLKTGYITTTDLNPYTAVREGYTFDGWWTAATGGSQVYDANLNLTSATISGYTSGGKLVLTANKNLYAHWILNACDPGLYMDNGACVACPENHYCVGGTTTAQACPTNLYTPNNTIAAYHDEAGDCGRKLHIGTDVLWLRSDKKSMNSANKALNFDFFNNDGVADLFLNLSTNPSPMSSTTNKNFKMNVGGTVYYGCDDGTCN